MKDINPKRGHSEFFKKTLESLTGSRRVNAQELIDTITRDKDKIKELQKSISEKDNGVQDTRQQIQKLRKGFLKLSEKKKLETATEITKLNNKVALLVKEKRELAKQKTARNDRVETLLKRLEELRQREHKIKQLRAERIEREEAAKEKQAKISVERERAYNEVNRPLEQFLSVDEPDEELMETVKALLKRYPVKLGMYGMRDAENQFGKDYPQLTPRSAIPDKLLRRALDKLKENAILS